MLSENEYIDGYRVVRKIGSGGFGTVYLVQKDDSSDFYALKAISLEGADKEIDAFEIYRKTPKTDVFVPIIESGIHWDVFYYVMPLADPLDANLEISASDIRFTPKTLGALLYAKSTHLAGGWFSPKEILDIIAPIFEAAIFIGDHGLLHRDIKPDNILFIGGKAKLADFGLLKPDTRSLSSAGTPYFTAPNWYMNSGGNPDMWGLATTFYMLITGNYPDSMGRAAYNLPENASEALTTSEKAQWAHWHRCIQRATAEAPADRFIRLGDFYDALLSSNFDSSLEYGKTAVQAGRNRRTRIYALCTIVAVMVFVIFAIFYSEKNIGVDTKDIEPQQELGITPEADTSKEITAKIEPPKNTITETNAPRNITTEPEEQKSIPSDKEEQPKAEPQEKIESLADTPPTQDAATEAAEPLPVIFTEEDERNIQMLKAINPIFETVYRTGVTIKNAKTIVDGEEVPLGQIELMSYRNWQADYKKKQSEYRANIERVENAAWPESTSNEIRELKFKIEADKLFFEYDTPASFRKYRKYIDMTLNPHKYAF